MVKTSSHNLPPPSELQVNPFLPQEFVTAEGQSSKSFQLTRDRKKGSFGCNAIRHASG